MTKIYRIHKPKIVMIGGGTGLPVILRALREQDVDVTAIVTVADDGGSSGEIRKSIVDMAPPGDLRNALVALSEMPKIFEELFQYRFHNSDQFLANHSLGNLIIAGLAEMKGSTYAAVQILGKMMQITGDVYPASELPLILHAVFTDGSTSSGESEIVKTGKQIERVFVTNMDGKTIPQPARKVIQAIKEADLIVLGPGSLFTSILPNLMIPAIGEAVKEAAGKVVYICNIMTQRGETEHFTDAQHVHVLNEQLESPFINTVLVNTKEVPKEYIGQEKGEYLFQVGHDASRLAEEKCEVISSDFLHIVNDKVYHDGSKVVSALLSLLDLSAQ